MHELLGAAAQRLVPEYGDGGGHDDAEAVLARERVMRLIEARGRCIQPGNKAADALAAALAPLARVGHGSFAELLDDYADAAERVARVDLEYPARHADREGLVEAVVVGTVVGDAVFAALRRMAQVDASSRLFAEERQE